MIAVKRLAVAALVPLLAACAGRQGDVVCTLEARSAVTVELHDARTGAALTGPATVVARAGSYADTASIPEDMSSTGLAYERAGLYEVTVRKSGYRDWTRQDVAVTRDECHVRTVQLRADLEPAA